MRFLLITVLALLVRPCFALGSDSWELFGVTKSGQKVTLAYGGYELDQQNKGMSLYVGPKQYGYCQPAASWEVDGEYLLLCSPKIGGAPTLIYKKDKNEMETPYYKAAMAICSKYFPRHKTTQPGCGGYYRCVKGCASAHVELLELIS